MQGADDFRWAWEFGDSEGVDGHETGDGQEGHRGDDPWLRNRYPDGYRSWMSSREKDG